MAHFFRRLRSFIVGSNWQIVGVSHPTRLTNGEVASNTWVKRRVNPISLKFEYAPATFREADEASRMWAIK